MRMIALAKRCSKEILRDPINLCFGLCFPLILIFLLNLIEANVPVNLFELKMLTPGITVFGLSFITLFTATLISKDRETAFLQRLYTTPITALDYFLAYIISVLPIAIAQTVICYIFAIMLGLKCNINIIFALIGIIPIAIFYILLGVLFGSILNVKQVGGVCGALLTNLSAWLSGVWFDLSLLGGFLKNIAYALPFVHAVEFEKALLNGRFNDISSHIFFIVFYSVVLIFISIYCFVKQTNNL